MLFFERMHNHTGYICVASLHCAFSNVPSNCLPETMHSHIACNCLTFLYCVFSNEPLDSLSGRMQSHTGCICLTFLHCASSNVPPNDLCEKMHNCTGCICLIFLHGEFWNASSNYLHQKSQIVCLPDMRFSMSISISFHESVLLVKCKFCVLCVGYCLRGLYIKILKELLTRRMKSESKIECLMS